MEELPPLPHDVRFAVTARTAHHAVGGLVVIVDFESDRVVELNATATQIWQELTRGSSVAEIRSALLERYEGSSSDIERDLQRCLAKLLADGWIERAAPEAEG